MASKPELTVSIYDNGLITSTQEHHIGTCEIDDAVAVPVLDFSAGVDSTRSDVDTHSRAGRDERELAQVDPRAQVGAHTGGPALADVSRRSQ